MRILELSVFDEDTTEQTIIGNMHRYGVVATIVQNTAGTIDIGCIREANDRIFAFAQQNKGKIFGMASVNPHIKKQDYIDEVSR